MSLQALLTRYKSKLTPERQKIVRELAKRKWFVNTSTELQDELITLPQEGAENHDGFLADLAARPERLGGVEVLSLHSLSRGAFGLIPRFDVRTLVGGHEYTYEYISWRHGPLSGAKGIVFVRPAADKAPTHFIVMVGEKFAPGAKVFDTIGGFIDLGVEGVQSVTDRMLLEIKQETGVADMPVDEVIKLGRTHTDAGMTNNMPALFMAFITSKDAARISVEQINPDIYELRAGPLVLPMSQLKQFCNEAADSYFFAALVKGIASDKTPKATKNAILKALA